MADVFGNGSERVSSIDNVLHRSEVTVLGVGNVILRDEGFGVRVVEYLDAHYEFPENVQLVDGGTLGIELTLVGAAEQVIVHRGGDGFGIPGILVEVREVLSFFLHRCCRCHRYGTQQQNRCQTTGENSFQFHW